MDFADFLLGLPYQTFYDVVQEDNDGQSTYYNFFAQDQWKANPKLTLTYGVRYELHPGYSDAHGDIGNFRSKCTALGAVDLSRRKLSLLASLFWPAQTHVRPMEPPTAAVINGAPCMPVLTNSQAGYPIGIEAISPLALYAALRFCLSPFNDDNTVIRGGFGMYNITLLGANFYSLTGTLQAQTTQYTNTLDTTTHTIGYQWPNIYAGAGNGGGTTCYGQDYFGTANSPNWKDPYTEQWSLSVDH